MGFEGFVGRGGIAVSKGDWESPSDAMSCG